MLIIDREKKQKSEASDISSSRNLFLFLNEFLKKIPAHFSLSLSLKKRSNKLVLHKIDDCMVTFMQKY
jgi:hypothetical protein